MKIVSKRDPGVEFYARNVADNKRPKLDDENRFTKITKKVNGEEMEFLKGKNSNSVYFERDGEVKYFADKEENFAKFNSFDLKIKEPKAPGEKRPRKAKAAKKEIERQERGAIFVENDGGRSESSRPKQKSDASVRAVALSSGISYDEAFDLVKSLGRQSNRSFDLSTAIDGQKSLGSRTIMKADVPQEQTLEDFVVSNPTGNFIVETNKSVGAVVNGQYLDERYDGSVKVQRAFQVLNASSATA